MTSRRIESNTTAAAFAQELGTSHEKEGFSLKFKLTASAIAAIAAIGMIFLEVKYGLLSAGLSMLLANPLVLGVMVGLPIGLIIYMIYRHAMRSSPSEASQSNGIESTSTAPSVPLHLHAAIAPASLEDLQNARVGTQAAIHYMRFRFVNRQPTAYTEQEAQEMVISTARSLYLYSQPGGNHPNPQAMADALNEFLPNRALAMRFLMTPI